MTNIGNERLTTQHKHKTFAFYKYSRAKGIEEMKSFVLAKFV